MRRVASRWAIMPRHRRFGSRRPMRRQRQAPGMTPADEIYVGRDLRPPRHRHRCGRGREVLRRRSTTTTPSTPARRRSGGRWRRRSCGTRRSMRIATTTGAAPAWYLPNLFGNLHARQELEFFAPVMVGDVIYDALGDCRALREARPRLRRQRSAVLRRRRRGRDARAARTRASCARRRAKASSSTRSARRRLDASSRSIRPRRSKRSRRCEKQISLDMCWKFSGPHKNYHNDKEMAIKWGFPDIVVQGMMSTCFLSEMLTNRYGAGWLAGGKMDVQPREHRLAERPPDLPRLRARDHAGGPTPARAS